MLLLGYVNLLYSIFNMFIQIADKVGNFASVGQDLLAMCCNDVMCHLAKPVVFVFYYGVGKFQKSRDVQVLGSIAAACERIECKVEGLFSERNCLFWSAESLFNASFAVTTVRY